MKTQSPGRETLKISSAANGGVAISEAVEDRWGCLLG